MDLSALLKHRIPAMAVAGLVAAGACGCGASTGLQSGQPGQATPQTTAAWADRANSILPRRAS